MLLKKTEGCLSWMREFDGEDLRELSEEKKEKALQFLKDQITPEDLEELFDFVVENHYTDFETSEEPCECCGDYITTWTLDTNKNLGN